MKHYIIHYRSSLDDPEIKVCESLEELTGSVTAFLAEKRTIAVISGEMWQFTTNGQRMTCSGQDIWLFDRDLYTTGFIKGNEEHAKLKQLQETDPQGGRSGDGGSSGE